MSDERRELKDAEEIVISDELLEKLEALSDARPGAKPLVWSPEQDAVLLKYWMVKRKVDVAKIVGYHTGPCRERYKFLTEGT